jgi:hypothetical protein
MADDVAAGLRPPRAKGRCAHPLNSTALNPEPSHPNPEAEILCPKPHVVNPEGNTPKP